MESDLISPFLLTLKSTETKDYQQKIGSEKLKKRTLTENPNLSFFTLTTKKEKTKNFIKI